MSPRRAPWRSRRNQRRAQAEFRASERVTGLCQHMGLPMSDPAARRYVQAGLDMYAAERRMVRTTWLETSVVIVCLLNIAITFPSWWGLFPLTILGLILPMHAANLNRWAELRDDFLTTVWTGPWPPVR